MVIIREFVLKLSHIIGLGWQNMSTYESTAHAHECYFPASKDEGHQLKSIILYLFLPFFIFTIGM